MSSRQGHQNAVDVLTGKDSAGGAGAVAGCSSAAALQNLAAARNARGTNPSPAIAPGSILQNALSGARGNSNFAPTLAQLLTNPAAEQQQQQQQQQQLQQQQLLTNSTNALPSDMVTLSNLLATAKVLLR